jgi:hypothetical protein
MIIPKFTYRRYQIPTGILHAQEDKGLAVFQHFVNHFGRMAPREFTLNWYEINPTRLNLQHLEEPFTEDEVHIVTIDTASDKAPGPNGLIDVFLKQCWPIIKEDVMQAVQFFYYQWDQHLRHLNTAPNFSNSREVECHATI